MFEDQKCCVGLQEDAGYVIPHDADGWMDSVQCNQPVVALEKYANFDDTILPVCGEHRPNCRLTSGPRRLVQTPFGLY